MQNRNGAKLEWVAQSLPSITRQHAPAMASLNFSVPLWEIRASQGATLRECCRHSLGLGVGRATVPAWGREAFQGCVGMRQLDAALSIRSVGMTQGGGGQQGKRRPPWRRRVGRHLQTPQTSGCCCAELGCPQHPRQLAERQGMPWGTETQLALHRGVRSILFAPLCMKLVMPNSDPPNSC